MRYEARDFRFAGFVGVKDVYWLSGLGSPFCLFKGCFELLRPSITAARPGPFIDDIEASVSDIRHLWSSNVERLQVGEIV